MSQNKKESFQLEDLKIEQIMVQKKTNLQIMVQKVEENKCKRPQARGQKVNNNRQTTRLKLLPVFKLHKRLYK